MLMTSKLEMRMPESDEKQKNAYFWAVSGFLFRWVSLVSDQCLNEE